MSTPDYPTLTVKKNEERRLLAGHPWAFSNELVSVPKEIAAGSVVQLVREANKQPFALAFYNPHSLIAARILTRDVGQTIDAAFFEARIIAAASRRDLLLKRRNAARIVHSESDFLPGLIVDKFNDILAFQISSVGFEVRKSELIEILRRVFQPKSIVEKNTSHARSREGLEQIEGLVFGVESVTEIHDGSTGRFEVDVLAGQKTGFYLDQMENRARVGVFTKPGMRALDLFSNEGGFAINLALSGVTSITAVDSSKKALERLQINAKLNAVSKQISTIESDCFTFLSNATADTSSRYDIVVLDPPALVKSKRELPTATKAYESLNANAMRLTEKEGILVTASCSHHVNRELFLEIIHQAARKARRAVTIMEERGAGIDHPILIGMPETEYLHVLFLRVH